MFLEPDCRVIPSTGNTTPMVLNVLALMPKTAPVKFVMNIHDEIVSKNHANVLIVKSSAPHVTRTTIHQTVIRGCALTTSPSLSAAVRPSSVVVPCRWRWRWGMLTVLFLQPTGTNRRGIRGKIFFDLFVAMCNHVDDLVDAK
jgi:hypothetical protein